MKLNIINTIQYAIYCIIRVILYLQRTTALLFYILNGILTEFNRSAVMTTPLGYASNYALCN